MESEKECLREKTKDNISSCVCVNRTLRQDVWVNFPNFNDSITCFQKRSFREDVNLHIMVWGMCVRVSRFTNKNTHLKSSVLPEKRYTCSHALRDEPTAVGTTTTPREDTVRLGSEH